MKAVRFSILIFYVVNCRLNCVIRYYTISPAGFLLNGSDSMSTRNLAAGDLPLLQEPSTEYVDFELFCLFPVDLTELRPKVPAPFEALEISTTKGLFGVGLQHFKPGNLGDLPAFSKVYTVVAAKPQYDAPMATPRFCTNVLSVMSTEPRFSEHTRQINRLPLATGANFRFSFDYDNYAVSLQSDEGPILELNSPAPRHTFRKSSAWGQNISVVDDEVYFSAWEWAGNVMEYKPKGTTGTLYDHPFFEGIKVNGIADECYYCMISKPGDEATMTIFRPLALCSFQA